MKHYREYFENEFIHAWQLTDDDGNKKDIKAKIKSVITESLMMEGGAKNDKMVIIFEKATKKLICCKTNAKAIAQVLNESDTDKWIGQIVTLFPTECKLMGEVVECIRIRTNKDAL